MYLDKENSYICRVDNNKGIMSNKFTGKYLYIPIECFDAIMYATEKNISLDKMNSCFEDLDDQIYYSKLLRILFEMGITTKTKAKKTNSLTVDHIKNIDISLTNRCNLNCGYCCTESGGAITGEMKFEEVKKMIDKVIYFLKPHSINLSGGEIFVRDDIYEIIDYARKSFKGHLSIQTNGTLIEEAKIDFLIKNVDSIALSLDGYNEDTVSMERGRGVFTKVINLIKNLKNKNFNNIDISLVLNKQTEQYIEGFKALSNELKIGYIIRGFVSIGRGKINANYVDDEQDVQFFDKSIDPSLYYENSMVCNAGIKSIFINNDGSVYMCPLLQDDNLKICNLKEIDEFFLKKISNREFKPYQIFDDIKMKRLDNCSECGYKLFCSKCPATMNLIYNNEELLKHNCKKFKKQLGI